MDEYAARERALTMAQSDWHNDKIFAEDVPIKAAEYLEFLTTGKITQPDGPEADKAS